MPAEGPLRNHLILCGAGSLAWYIVEELEAGKRRIAAGDRPDEVPGNDYLVIDPSAEALGRLCERVAGLRTVAGDPTEDHVLEQAGLRSAYGLFAALPSEKDNLYITLTARQRSPRIRIVAVTADPLHFTQRLTGAGADAVVSPNFIGGMRLVSEAARPTVTAFLDEMLRDRNPDLQIHEVEIAAGSELCGQPLAALRLPQRTGLVLIALARRGEDHYLYNPGADTVIQPGDTAVVLGGRAQVHALAELAR